MIKKSTYKSELKKYFGKKILFIYNRNRRNIEDKSIDKKSIFQNMGINNNNSINEQKRANKFSKISTIFNILLFVVTIITFMLNIKAVNSAVKSAEAAQNTYIEQRFNDSIMRFRDSMQSHKDSISARIKFALDSTSITAQINSFKEAKSEFQAEYMPIFAMTDLIAKPFVVNKNITAEANFEYFGKAPIFIHYTMAGINGNYSDTIIPIYIKNNLRVINTFAPSGFKLAIPFRVNNITSQSLIDDVRHNKYFIYAYGKIFFKDLIRNQEAVFKFNFLLDAEGKIRISEYHNGIEYLNKKNEM